MKRVRVLILVFGLVGVLTSVSPTRAQTRRVMTIAAGAVDGVYFPIAGALSRIATQASGVKSVRDLKGKRVVLGPPGSATEQNAIQVLAAQGLAETDLRSAERAPFTTAVEQVKSVIDAAFFRTAIGAQVVAEVLEAGKLSLIPAGREAGETLERKYPFYTAGEIPARTYEGRDQAVPAVMAMLVARSNLSEDLVYGLTRAVFDNLTALHAGHPAARSLSPQTVLVAIPLPPHPGAELFFRGRGIAR